MQVSADLLYRFEAGLNPQDLESAPIPATVLGYGEISTIFQIGDNANTAFKRMPLFANLHSAKVYIDKYEQYCRHLTTAGLILPADRTVVVEVPNRPIVLYIGQQQIPPEHFAHHLIHRIPPAEITDLFEDIVAAIAKIWRFNTAAHPGLEIAIDGQLSNWAVIQKSETATLYYVDTSTPLYRIDGVEQLDPELMLQSAPGFLRWIIRWLFLADVMNRYYDQRQVYIDLAANLYKEQRPDLIPLAIEIINNHLAADLDRLTAEEISSYYREDKLIWTVFLAFRRVDRWLKTHLLRQRYEFILPGKIER